MEFYSQSNLFFSVVLMPKLDTFSQYQAAPEPLFSITKHILIMGNDYFHKENGLNTNKMA